MQLLKADLEKVGLMKGLTSSQAETDKGNYQLYIKPIQKNHGVTQLSTQQCSFHAT